MSKLKRIILKNNITDLKLFYEGAYNKTYKGFFCEETIQLRIAKNKIVKHDNELKLLKNRNNIIYIDKKIMIKKWINGDTLNSNSKEILIKIKDVLKEHWNIKLNRITSLNYSEISTNEVIVLSHGDLRPKNIIIDSESNVHLIDFEWIRYTDMYFDLSHLYLYCFFSIQDIVDVFKVDEEKLKIAIHKVNLFNDQWKEKYN